MHTHTHTDLQKRLQLKPLVEMDQANEIKEKREKHTEQALTQHK